MINSDSKYSHAIDIKNFGSISRVTMMNITDILFLIGEQASGKSTVAKLIYFFRSLHREFASIIFSDFDNWNNCGREYISLAKSKFTNIFGVTKNLGDFEITYFYSPEFWVKITPNITPDGDYLSIYFEPFYKLAEIWKDAFTIVQYNKGNALKRYVSMMTDTEARVEIENNVKKLFSEDCLPIYIPAGRALLSRPKLADVIKNRVLEDNKEKYSPYDIVDATTLSYISEVGNVRGWLAPEHQATLNIKSNDKKLIECLEFLKETSENILKGKYVLINDYEHIQLIDGKNIPLSYASSGQQEVVWLLNVLRYHAFFERKCFVIIEEPETHLHPDAQYLLVKYIAAFSKATESQIFITTHSPYILTSFNNLFYADKCNKRMKHGDNASLKDIIDEKCWLDAEMFSSYILEKEDKTKKNTEIKIRDDELGMTNIAKLDAVASKQDDEYEMLLHISRGGV